MGRLIVGLTLMWLLVAQTASAADEPGPVGAGISGRLSDRSALVQGRRHLPVTKPTRATASAQRKILTSYQRVCSANAKDDYAMADVCHRSSSLCPATTTGTARTTSTPVWVMRAPATPTPGPDDWTNTGVITCRTNAAGRPAVPIVTAADFRRLPIPPAKISIQPDPAKSPTLINIPTNLYTADRPTTLPTTILGQPVRVRAIPTSYTWRYGDGTTATTRNSGGPYPDLSTGHTYRQPGTYSISLTTTYTGQYSVAEGPWQPINGTAAVTSPAVQVIALEARNQLTR